MAADEAAGSRDQTTHDVPSGKASYFFVGSPEFGKGQSAWGAAARTGSEAGRSSAKYKAPAMTTSAWRSVKVRAKDQHGHNDFRLRGQDAEQLHENNFPDTDTAWKDDGQEAGDIGHGDCGDAQGGVCRREIGRCAGLPRGWPTGWHP